MALNRDLNHYERLGIARTATAEEIKKAFKKKAIELHPDKHPNVDTTESMAFLNDARDVLSDPNKRAAYDAKLSFSTRFTASNSQTSRPNSTSGSETFTPKKTSSTSADFAREFRSTSGYSRQEFPMYNDTTNYSGRSYSFKNFSPFSFFSRPRPQPQEDQAETLRPSFRM